MPTYVGDDSLKLWDHFAVVFNSLFNVFLFQTRDAIKRQIEQDKITKQREDARKKMEREKRVSVYLIFSWTASSTQWPLTCMCK